MTVDIKGYEGIYQVSDDATVTNVLRNKPIKPWMHHSGYQVVDLSKDGERKHIFLHRIMATAFVPNPDNHPIVLHLDNNKLNIDPSNLAWGTLSENSLQAVRDGLVVLPDRRKDFCIVDSEGHDNALYYHGYAAVASAIGGITASGVESMTNRGSTIQKGSYAGCHIEKVIG